MLYRRQPGQHVSPSGLLIGCHGQDIPFRALHSFKTIVCKCRHADRTYKPSSHVALRELRIGGSQPSFIHRLSTEILIANVAFQADRCCSASLSSRTEIAMEDHDDPQQPPASGAGLPSLRPNDELPSRPECGRKAHGRVPVFALQHIGSTRRATGQLGLPAIRTHRSVLGVQPIKDNFGSHVRLNVLDLRIV